MLLNAAGWVINIYINIINSTLDEYRTPECFYREEKHAAEFASVVTPVDYMDYKHYKHAPVGADPEVIIACRVINIINPYQIFL